MSDPLLPIQESLNAQHKLPERDKNGNFEFKGRFGLNAYDQKLTVTPDHVVVESDNLAKNVERYALKEVTGIRVSVSLHRASLIKCLLFLLAGLILLILFGAFLKAEMGETVRYHNSSGLVVPLLLSLFCFYGVWSQYKNANDGTDGFVYLKIGKAWKRIFGGFLCSSEYYWRRRINEEKHPNNPRACEDCLDSALRTIESFKFIGTAIEQAMSELGTHKSFQVPS